MLSRTEPPSPSPPIAPPPPELGDPAMWGKPEGWTPALQELGLEEETFGSRMGAKGHEAGAGARKDQVQKR